MSGELAHVERRTGLRHDWSDGGPGAWAVDAETWVASARLTRLAPAADEARAVETARHAARALAGGIGSVPGLVAAELRVASRPGTPTTVHVRCRTLGSAAVAASTLSALTTLLAPTYRAVPDVGPAPLRDLAEPVAIELQRPLTVAAPAYPLAAQHYRVERIAAFRALSGDGSGWANLHEALDLAAAPVDLSILLKPARLAPAEGAAADAYASALGSLGHDHQTMDLLHYTRTIKADAAAADAGRLWDERLRALRDGCLLVRVAVRGEAPAVQAVLGGVSAGLSLDASGAATRLEPSMPGDAAGLRQLWQSIDDLDLYPDAEGSRLGDDRFARFAYLTPLAEAARLLPLPVPTATGAPGVEVGRAIDAARSYGDTPVEGRTITLGRLKDAAGRVHEARLAVDSLTMHTGVFGAPGSGKSNSVRVVLEQLWREHGIPFLVLEQSKPEYAAAFAHLEGLTVLNLGGDDSGLRINPLAPRPGEHRFARQSRVLATLKLALALPHPLPELLAITLDELCERDDADRATLATLRHQYATEFARIGYTGEARNIGLAFGLRLDALRRGVVGRVVDSLESTDFDELLTRPVVISLDGIADPEERRLLAALILAEASAVARRRGIVDGLRHVTVFEEAHHLLSSGDARGAGGEEGDRLRADSVAAFAASIAELRAHGEGFVTVTQFPGKLVDDVLANSSTVLLHRLMLADDQHRVAPAGARHDETVETLGRLRRGEILLRTTERPELVGVDVAAASRAAVGTAPPPPAISATLRPLPLCGAEACPAGCSPEVRATGARGSRALLPVVATRLAEHPTARVATVAASLDAPDTASPRERYCVVAHLHAQSALVGQTTDADTRRETWAAVGGGTENDHA